MTADPEALWQAVALSRDVGAQPFRVVLDGAPVVLFRANGTLAALADRCPHRQVPLSQGRVVDGTLQCPYHGWRFDAQGQLAAIPGHPGDPPRCRIPRLQVTERAGAVFLSRGQPARPPHAHVLQDSPAILRLVKSTTRSTVIDAAENILDATHTHFTHRGLLRGLTSRRHRVSVAVNGGPGWVEATYTGEDRQSGLISTLLEGARSRTIGRYRHPGIAELEYWGPRGLVLATTFHLRQTDADTVEGIGFLCGPRQGLWGQVKALAFKPMFRIALAQDRRVLAAATDNARLAGGLPHLAGPLDILRRDIEAIAAGRLPPAAEAPRLHQMEL